MRYPAFIGGSAVAQSPLASQERTVNFYPERLGDQWTLYPTPGVIVHATASGQAPGRGAFAQDGRAFCVIGTKFYEIPEAGGTLTERGTVASDEWPATICSNGRAGGQLFITSGNNGYVYDLSTDAFTTERTGGTRMGAYLSGRFLALDVEEGEFHASAIDDGTSWPGGLSAGRSLAPDPWVSMVVHDRSIWLLGTETSEVWYDAGLPNFPFDPHPSSGVIPYGTPAPFSPKSGGVSLSWLAANATGEGSVVQARGFQVTVISDPAVQHAIEHSGALLHAVGDIDGDRGHLFYLLTLPSGMTHAYDDTTGVWCERGTWLSESGQYTAWRPLYLTHCWGQHLALDRSAGHVYRLSGTSGVDVEERVIRRLRRAPLLQDELRRLFYGTFELDLEPGLGLVSGQGSDPQVSLRLSNDGGKTWGSERWRSAGRMGEYGKRVRWTRCGSARRRVAEIVVSDPIPYRLMDAYLHMAPVESAA